MFTADTNITDLKVREKRIYKILFSMNIHQVATPELSVEDARCYVIFFQEGDTLSAYIGLHFLRTGRTFYYSHSSNSFPAETLNDVEEEAHSFIEDMGFVLDELNLGGMSVEEKNRWLDEQEIFAQKKEAPPARPGQTAPPQQRTVPQGAPGAVSRPAAPQRGHGAGSTTSMTNREREAIARLLASF